MDFRYNCTLKTYAAGNKTLKACMVKAMITPAMTLAAHLPET